MSTQNWDHNDCFIEKTRNDCLFGENQGFSRDQMMLGGYKYDDCP